MARQKLLILVVIWFLVFTFFPPKIWCQMPESKPTAFVGVNVIPMDKERILQNQTVIIRDGVIVEIGDAQRIKVPRDARRVNAQGKFLIPGLWDMHVHLDFAGESALPLFIANGVTGIRDMGGDFLLIKKWRDAISSGTLVGPRIKTSGPILENPKAIERYEKLMQISMANSRIGVAAPEGAADKITYLAKLGVDFLKIRTNANRETYLAIAAEAKRQGLTFVGHAPVGLSLVEVSNAGQKSIEHYLFVLGPNFTEEQWKDVSSIFVKNGTYLVPTFISGRGFRLTPDDQIEAVINDTSGNLDSRRKYVSPELIEFWSKELILKKNERLKLDYYEIEKKNFEIFRLMKRAGVRLMTGTDLAGPMVFPGFSLHDELGVFVNDVGMTPYEALECATKIPAEFFGLQTSLGTIEKGKTGDVVLLDANPLDGIGNTKKISGVLKDGKFYSRADIEKILSQVKTNFRSGSK